MAHHWPHSGGRTLLLTDHDARVQPLRAAQPAAPRAELQSRIAKKPSGKWVQPTRGRRLQRLRWVRKKSPSRESQQQRTAVVEHRAACGARAADGLASRLQWLAEMGSQLTLTRDYGRALPGEPVVTGVPSADGRNYTRRGVLGLDGLEAPWLVAGARKGEGFQL